MILQKLEAAAPQLFPPSLPSPIYSPSKSLSLNLSPQWRSRKVSLGPLPSLLTRSLPIPLDVGPILRLRGPGEPQRVRADPGRQTVLVHFKHYFHRERIEKQISNSKI